MKKIACLFFFLQSLVLAAQSKPGKISFFVGGGYLSAGYLKEAVFKNIHTNKESHKHICILLNTGFRYHVSGSINAGLNISYDHFGLEDRSTEHNVLSFMLRGEKIWHNTKRLLLYSGAAAGISSFNKKESGQIIHNGIRSCYQIYLWGTGIKGENAMLDFSLGYGVTGLLNFQIQYTF